jgi:hypothetical protein
LIIFQDGLASGLFFLKHALLSFLWILIAAAVSFDLDD